MSQQEEPGGKNAKKRSQLCLPQGREDQHQWRLETHKCCTANSISKLSSDSITVLGVPFTLSPSITCPPWVLSHHVSYLSIWVCFSWYYSANQPESLEVARNCSTPPEDFFLLWFSLWSPDKCSSTMQCKMDQYMHVVKKESFVMCAFEYLL